MLAMRSNQTGFLNNATLLSEIIQKEMLHFYLNTISLSFLFIIYLNHKNNHLYLQDQYYTRSVHILVTRNHA